MNQVITDGLILMPPAFADDLSLWSREDGRPGQNTWATAPNASVVAADPDFGDCLEILKVDGTTRVRFTGQTPIIPGLYLKVSVRLKVLSGALPTARIAAWPGQGNDTPVTGLQQTTNGTDFAGFGSIVTVSAIIGTGQRGGVDLAWGTDPSYAHIGFDLIGPNGGQVRVENIQVEDITTVFHRKMMDWVDVRDFGAVGDGTTDDRAAFAAADAAADGREILVPAGTFRIDSNLTLTNPVRFEGTLSMPDSARLALNENFDLDGYAEAFGDDVEGLKKGLQQLFNQSDFETFDLCGRRVVLTEPLDVQAAVGNRNTYANRRVLRNGQLAAATSSAWNDEVHSRGATWAASAPAELRNVANAGSIPIGARVSGAQGVGREVYVRDVNVASGRVYLSSELSRPPSSQNYTFTRHQFLLDFIGWQNLQRFIVSDVEFLCGGLCSGINLPLDGLIFQIQDCFFTGPKDKGITSANDGCQGMQIDRCQFLSNEQVADVPDRVSIAFNVNTSDCKIRDNRSVKFLHFGVISGPGHLISGNHFFQGDAVSEGVRSPGLVIADNNAKITLTGNYIDNCYIEWTNEHDSAPDFSSGLSFHGLTIQGNMFFSTDSAPWMRFISIKPYGSGHFINGMSVTGNLFKKTNGAQIDQVEGVDTSIASLDLNRTADLQFDGNTYHGIVKRTENPAYVRTVQNTASSTWNVDLSDVLPFGAPAKYALSLQPDGPIRNGSNVMTYTMPFTQGLQGTGGQSIAIGWSTAVRGAAYVTARCDN